MPHVAQVSFFLDPRRRRPRELLRDWSSLAEVAEAASRSVRRVSVVQASAYADEFEQNGVDYHFVRPEGGGRRVSRTAAFARLLAQLRPDVLHVHGLGFAADVAALARLAPATPILLQDHADRLPPFWRRGAWRRGTAHASGIAACATEQITPFAAAGLLPPQMRVFEIPESTSRFTPADRDEARAATGLHGDPALLWVGRLDRNKDPLTVLEAVRCAVASLPGLALWCCFAAAPLRREVERRVAADPQLRARVHLLGIVAHKRIELLMRAADLYVSASHREGSGYALLEALACALPPVVSDIPSFRALTGRGRIGDLWPPGDAAALARALVAAAARAHPAARARVRAYFEAELASGAVGRKLGSAYRQLLDSRRSGHGAGA